MQAFDIALSVTVVNGVSKIILRAIVCFLCSLSAGGSPARFLIIDDGWQDTFNEIQRETEPVIDGAQ